MSMSSDKNPVQHVAELVKNARIAMVTTMTQDGRHLSRPMGLQEAEFDGDLWFFTSQDSDLVEQVRAHPEVNVAFSNTKSSEWTSVSGRAEMVHDRAKAEQLWSAPMKAWFEDGLDTPGLTLLKVHAESAQYWESPSSKVLQLIGMARAAITGDSDKFPGDTHEVTL